MKQEGNNLRLELDPEMLARIARERKEELQALRIAVAERIFGFKRCEEGVWLTPLDLQNGDPYDAFTLLEELPEYSTDLNACAHAEQRILVMALGERYAEAMWATARLICEEEAETRMALLIAPAEERCKAMLAVLEAK